MSVSIHLPPQTPLLEGVWKIRLNLDVFTQIHSEKVQNVPWGCFFPKIKISVHYFNLLGKISRVEKNLMSDFSVKMLFSSLSQQGSKKYWTLDAKTFVMIRTHWKWCKFFKMRKQMRSRLSLKFWSHNLIFCSFSQPKTVFHYGLKFTKLHTVVV